MFQSSIKKITERLVIVSAVLCAGLWFAGCGQKEEEEKKEDPLNVSGGEVTKGGDGDNTSVTEANLDDFLVEFGLAFGGNPNSSKSGSAARSKRDDRPAEYDKNSSTWTGSAKIYGDSSGYAEATSDGGEGEDETATSEIEWDLNNKTIKYFNFSNTNKLFLGGAFGSIYKSECKYDASSQYEYGVSSDTLKINGKIDFQGAFKGKIVFDNISSVIKYTQEEIQGEMGPEYKKKILDGPKESGNFYIESNGQKVKLHDSLLAYFTSYPNSQKGWDYGDDKITLARPAVPAAPSGNLTERAGGAAVNADNVGEFFSTFRQELNDRSPRATEEIESGESINHGAVSGYVFDKWENKYQENKSGAHKAGTQTVKYDDYSNNGNLYFGGGFGRSIVGFRKDIYTSESYSSTQKDTTVINGKVKFNGEFKGELDFQNFKFEYKYESGTENYVKEYKLISGSVKIASFDATDSYIQYFLDSQK